MHGRPWLWLLLSWVIPIVTSPLARTAYADSASVTVLGVRSIDAEDQLERRVSQAVRSSARSIEGYRVSDREVSLAQMSLAHGCDDVDVACLKDIAATLSADRLIYGNLVRSGDKIRITLFNFDARTGQIDASAERTVLAAQLVEPSLSEIMLGLTQRLTGKGKQGFGVLRVTGNRPGASVAIDGKVAGTLGSDGEVIITQVAEGPHVVSVVSPDGRERREQSVEVRAETTATLRALLTPPLAQVSEDKPEPAQGATPQDKAAHSRAVKRGLGWASMGVAAGFAAATIYSWVRIGKIAEDPALLHYANYWPSQGPNATNDACKQAIDGELAAANPGDTQKAASEATASDLCKEADRLETLQYVFIGGGLAFAGVGTWLLWKGYRKEPASLSLRPNLSLRSASLHATLRF